MEEMVSKFRVVRLQCQISLGEVAKAANISHQRLSQIEMKRYGSNPQNPERLIQALETVLHHRKMELERVEKICREERQMLFSYVKEGVNCE